MTKTTPFQPYHAALELPLDKASEYIATATSKTAASARAVLRALLEGLPDTAHARCAVLWKETVELPLEKILASHAAVRAAEGLFFRKILAEAAQRCGLEITLVEESRLDHTRLKQSQNPSTLPGTRTIRKPRLRR